MEKGSAPPMDDPKGPMGGAEAPPSYEQSLGDPMVGGGPAPPPLPGQYDYKAPGGFVASSQPPAPILTAAPPTVQPAQVVVQYVNAPNFGPTSVRMTCPQCQSQIETSTTSEPGPMAYVIAVVLCVVGLWPCACIPCCIDQLNSVTHKCPNCQTFLGRYKGGM